MAIPNSKSTLKEYCLRNLGKGAVQINITDDQADDRLDEALQYFSHYYYDGIEKMYLKYKITAAEAACSIPLKFSALFIYASSSAFRI